MSAGYDRNTRKSFLADCKKCYIIYLKINKIWTKIYESKGETAK